MSKFVAGQKVKCVNKKNNTCLELDKIYTVKEVVTYAFIEGCFGCGKDHVSGGLVLTDDEGVSYGDESGLCPERFVPLDERPSPIFPMIGLRPAHAKPSHPKLPCCGWCGDVLVKLYSPATGMRPGCSVHGVEAPVVSVGAENRRHP